jgi:hypothetical protein
MHENRETSETPAAQPGRRSAGEGLTHKARAYVYEESHSGIVGAEQRASDENQNRLLQGQEAQRHVPERPI